MPRRPFWIAQVSGWTLYALILWLSMLPILADAPLSLVVSHLRMKGLMAGTGFLVSLLLWVLYERLLTRSPALGTLVWVAVPASIAAGLLWTVFVRVLDQPG